MGSGKWVFLMGWECLDRARKREKRGKGCGEVYKIFFVLVRIKSLSGGMIFRWGVSMFIRLDIFRLCSCGV